MSDHYTLWLSNTSIAVQPDGDGMVAMQFPATRRVASQDDLRVEYRNVFPKIDLLIYRTQVGFEYDWKVAPGADASALKLSFQGARDMRIGSEGDLILGTTSGEVRHGRPFAYQEIDGHRHPVPAAFDLGNDGHVRFRLGAYDKTKPLVIDPALSFVSGIGGSGLSTTNLFYSTPHSDLGSGMALDGNGNIYIVGLAYSPDFPLVNPLPLSLPALNAYSDACPSSFAAKLSPDGKTILYSTLLAACSSSPPSIAADSSGNVYVAGMVQGGYSFVQVGGGTATANVDECFVAKLDLNGVLKAAIAFGGSSADAASSIALAADGKLYVTGTTGSSAFPVTAGALQSTLSSTQDLFLMKLDPTLLAGNQLPPNSVLYSTYLGPGSSPVVTADASGNAYVAASTTSTAWNATPGVFQSQCWDAARTGCADVIALKVNPSGNQFIYTTYLGGSETDTVGGLALNASGNAYLTGTTNSFDFPTTAGAYVQQFDSGALFSETSFAVELSADASHLIYGTFLPSQNDLEGGITGTAIAIDASGDAWVGGSTTAQLLPVQNGIQQTLFNAVCFYYTGQSPSGQGYCPQSGYLAELNPPGTALLWATYLGSGNVTPNFNPSFPPAQVLNSIVFDAAGNVLVTGNQLALTDAAATPAKSNSASVVRITPSGTSLSNMAVQNAAGFIPGLPAPGGLAALYVNGITETGTFTAPGLPLPTELGGVTVLVDGMAAPLLAVVSTSADTQINFQVPFEVGLLAAEPEAHIVEVQFAGQSAFIVPQQAGPGIFLLPDGGGAIQHASDYSLVTVQNPVQRGETLIIYAGGLGAVSIPVATGAESSGADPIGPNACNQVTTNAGTVRYAGLTPAFPGLYQVNVQVSQYLPPGVIYIYLQSEACWDFFPPMNVSEGNAVAIYIPN